LAGRGARNYAARRNRRRLTRRRGWGCSTRSPRSGASTSRQSWQRSDPERSSEGDSTMPHARQVVVPGLVIRRPFVRRPRLPACSVGAKVEGRIGRNVR
jgi:hypothetical protein